MRSNDEVEGDPTQRRGVDTDRVQGNPYNSLSGKERNHLFLSCRAEQFAEMSPLSGLDHEGDSVWCDAFCDEAARVLLKQLRA